MPRFECTLLQHLLLKQKRNGHSLKSDESRLIGRYVVIVQECLNLPVDCYEVPVKCYIFKVCVVVVIYWVGSCNVVFVSVLLVMMWTLCVFRCWTKTNNSIQ
jgi:hypothetical protein